MPRADAPGPTARDGSLLLITLWILIGAAVMIFGAQAQDIARMRRAAARFDHARAVWAARGAVHYAIGSLASFPVQPALALEAASKAQFPKVHRNDDPIGWFVARTPYPAGDADYGIQSEQARMPLSNLPPGAIARLFGANAAAFRQEVAARQNAAGQGTTSVRVNVFAHPLELIAPPLAFDRSIYQGRDRNDNFVLDPQELGLTAASPRVGGTGVDRGIQDLVTTLTDGKFAAYDAPDPVVKVFLADFPAMPDLFARYRSQEDRPEPSAFLDVVSLSEDQKVEWRTLCQRALAPVTTYFRVEGRGTVRGEPVARVALVAETVMSPDQGPGGSTAPPWFRIVDWRQDR
jgi:hypothetical protein